jgi:hypothetical protein
MAANDGDLGPLDALRMPGRLRQRYVGEPVA